LPYREREKEGGEGETDKQYDGEWTKGLGFERLLADAFNFDNADGEGREVVGVTGSL
jgi:hypothetical protein